MRLAGISSGGWTTPGNLWGWRPTAVREYTISKSSTSRMEESMSATIGWMILIDLAATTRNSRSVFNTTLTLHIGYKKKWSELFCMYLTPDINWPPRIMSYMRAAWL